MNDIRITNAEHTLLDVQGFRKRSDEYFSADGGIRARIGDGFEELDLFGRSIPLEKQVRHIHF